MDPAIGGRRPEEPEIESRVVGHEHRAARELEERGHHRSESWCPDEVSGVDAGEPTDMSRERTLDRDERGQLGQNCSTPDTYRADLGDLICSRPGAGGLQVHHDEGDLGQQRFQVIERRLDAGRWGRAGSRHGVDSSAGVGQMRMSEVVSRVRPKPRSRARPIANR